MKINLVKERTPVALWSMMDILWLGTDGEIKGEAEALKYFYLYFYFIFIFGLKLKLKVYRLPRIVYS